MFEIFLWPKCYKLFIWPRNLGNPFHFSIDSLESFHTVVREVWNETNESFFATGDTTACVVVSYDNFSFDDIEELAEHVYGDMDVEILMHTSVPGLAIIRCVDEVRIHRYFNDF